MKGILFKPENIKAIMEGKKTQTRRVAGLKEINKEPDKWRWCKVANIPSGFLFEKDGQFKTIHPHYRVGEVVYIKEGIYRCNDFARYFSDNQFVYFLQSANLYHWRWNRDMLSPMFLPTEAARYFIKITDVQPQRLQEITEGDAIAEGCQKQKVPYDTAPYWLYKDLWHSINGKKSPWESNPWVCRYIFQLLEKETLRV